MPGRLLPSRSRLLKVLTKEPMERWTLLWMRLVVEKVDSETLSLSEDRMARRLEYGEGGRRTGCLGEKVRRVSIAVRYRQLELCMSVEFGDGC